MYLKKKNQDFYMKNLRCLSILCNKCETANDIDYNFCKNCGISRNQANRCEQNIGLQDNNRDNIMCDNDSRLKHLDDLLDSSNYSKQKCSLKSEFSIFF